VLVTLDGHSHLPFGIFCIAVNPTAAHTFLLHMRNRMRTFVQFGWIDRGTPPIGMVQSSPDILMKPPRTVVMYRSKKLDAPLELEYVEETLRSAQRRFEARTTLSTAD
jgi:hypothetical protein